MAIHTNFGLSSNLSYWFTRDASSISSASSSTVDLVNTDGTHTVLTSAGNDFTFTNSGGITLTGGTITSMARTDGASTTYENVTGLSYPATTFQSRLPNSDLQGVANDIFGGADTFAGSAINDFFRTYGGNDTVNGGAGFDTVSYFSGFMTGPVAITVGTTNTVGAPTVSTGTATAASNTIGTDTLNDVEQFVGTSGSDTFTAFANFFSNNSSFNQFEGLGGNDTIVGNGNTRIAFNNNSFSSGPAGATLTWTNSAGNTNGSGTSTGTGVGTDTFSGVNAVFGSQFNDVFTATGASNASYGVFDNGFNFIGAAGNDLLTGGGTSVRWDFNFSRYDFETSGITVTLGTTNAVGAPTTDIGSVTGATAGTDTLHYIEGIRGTNSVDAYTAFADFRGLYGSYNEFEGMAGNDTITGNGATRLAFGNATAGVTVTWTATPGNAFTGNGTASGDSSVGTDTFTGVNSARGSAFNDTFTATGAHGTFSFDGRAGNDTYNGGTFNFAAVDFDTAMYNRATSGITATMDSTSSVTGDSSVGTDSLNQIEEIRGSHFNDSYTATAAFSASFGKLNVFSPGGGDDTITGNGATQLDYHTSGGALAAVTVNLKTGVAQSTAAGDLAQIGTDTFTGVNGARGSQFNDTFVGSDGAQAEIFRGEEGNDQIDGGLGSRNMASYSDSIAGIAVNLSTGTASDGWGGTDTLVGIQDVLGSEFADRITGDSGSNILIGRNGDDMLFGAGGNDILIGDDNGVNTVTNNAFGTFAEFNVGNDTLNGGAGDDLLVGGPGDDRYVFAQGDGNDTIGGFVAGAGSVDKIVLEGVPNLHTLSDVLALTTQQGADAVINFGGGDSITLQNVQKTDLSADDFVLDFFSQPAVRLAGAFNPGNGWTSQDQFPRHLADVNGDGSADIVAFGNGGVYVSLANGDGSFAPAAITLAGTFNPGNGWTSDDAFHRELADVNGDHMADIVGFGNGGVYVSLATGGGNFAPFSINLAAFNPGNGWTSQDQFPRELADVNGDGLADIVGFGNGGVYVSLATGGGNFAAANIGLAAALNPGNGWTSQDQFPRELADVNGDGMADIVGFGNGGAYVALATGGGNFATPIIGLAALNPVNGWTSQHQFLRELADVNHDGMADIVGFGNGGVYVAVATGGGHFAAPIVDIAAFNPGNGWTGQDAFPRELADVNHDGSADIVGFGNPGVLVALANDFHLV